MNFGLLMAFRNPPPGVPFTEIYRKHLELAEEAEALGYDTLWLTEHHFVDDGYSPSLLPIAAALAARTKKIRIGTFVILLPLHNPIRVAEDAATADVISNGRIDLGFGQGYRVPEFSGFNISRKERGARLEENTEIVRRLFTEQNLSFQGRFNRISGATLMPPAVQRPHPPIWLAARGPKSIARAARNGYHLMGTGGVDQQQTYDAALRESGRDPADFNIAQLRTVFVAPRRAAAWDAAEAGAHYIMSCYGKWFAEANDLPGDSAYSADLPPVGKLRDSETAALFGEPLIIGTPAEAIAMIEDYQARTRMTHLVMAMVLPKTDFKKITASLRLFAKEVMPHFRRKARAKTRRAHAR
ncbi:MAG TPA: LLM class flavin-dependent oxidoreductase [Candidatus Binataceae bacterium]|nr:LLM class flavin-dependent oxidoreductase [Candidatus Binataceae bacterium]